MVIEARKGGLRAFCWQTGVQVSIVLDKGLAGIVWLVMAFCTDCTVPKNNAVFIMLDGITSCQHIAIERYRDEYHAL